MKKILLLCLVALITGCSGDDNDPAYSEKQQNALAVFNGTFADHQYSNIDGNDILPDPDMFIFGKQYSEPLELNAHSEAHGECTYKKMPYKGAAYENIECYYKVAYDASALTLYKKSDKEIYHTYTLLIDSKTEFRLFQTGISLPYIFKKQ